jgi:hypothetical protein
MKNLLILTIIFIGILSAFNAKAGIIIKPVFNAGLVGYWNFQEGAGNNVYDKTGYDNDGTWNGTGSHWADGKIGKAGSFNGSSNYVSIPENNDSLDITGSLTITAWVYPTVLSPTDAGHIVDKGAASVQNYQFYQSNAGEGLLEIDFYNEGWNTHTTAANTITPNQWQFVVFVFDSTNNNVRILVDNVEKLNEAETTDMIANDEDLLIGGSSGETKFQGLIDEVRIYNRALSASEVERLYKLSQPKILAPTKTGLVGYWSFEENTGTNVGDMSGNGNNGTWTGSGSHWTTGKLGNGGSFGENDNYVSATVPQLTFNNGDEYTISAWFKVGIPDDWQCLFEKSVIYSDFWTDVGVRFWINFDGDDEEIYGRLNSGTTSIHTGYIFTPNAWHHVTATMDENKKVSLYINGVFINSATNTDDLSGANNETFHIGIIDTEIGDGWSYVVNGTIDEVRIYNRALEPSEITALYNSGLAKINASQNNQITNGLVGLWSFNGPDMEAPSWLSGWTYRKKITISTTNVDENLTYFPVYVPIVDDTDIGANALSTGYDIRFTSSNGTTELYYERLNFAVAAGEADGDFYVRVPSISGTADTDIYMYYGKSDAADASDHENTFPTSDGWAGVWHLEESGSGYLDATSNNNDSTGQDAPTRVSGKVGYGQDFELDNTQYIRIATSDSLNFGASDDITVSAWMKPEVVDIFQQYLGKGVNTAWYKLYLNTEYAGFQIWDGTHSSTRVNYVSPLSAGNWFHVASRCDRDNASGHSIAVNGSFGETNDPTAVGSLSSTDDFFIAAKSPDETNFDGVLDELRVSKTFRSNAWVKFEYYNSDDGHAAGNELAWSGQENRGIAHDRSGQGNTGTIYGADPTIGKLGQALDFDGSDDYVLTPIVNTNYGQEATIVAWVKFNHTAAESTEREGIVGSNYWEDGNFSFHLHDTTNQIFLSLGNSKYVYWLPTLETTQFHHLALVVQTTQTANANKVRLYYDGSLIPQSEFVGITNESLQCSGGYNIKIGSNAYNTHYGKIDEVRIYNRALTAQEILRLYNMGR